MNLLTNNLYIKNFFIYTAFLVSSSIIASLMNYTMYDDGWRHLAMALHPDDVKSWGEIYPYSLYGTYDPWWLWHKFLSFFSNYFPVPKIHIVVNSLVYSALSFWYFLVIKKFTKYKNITIIIFAIFLPLLLPRYFYLRPDLLSGIFCIYFILTNNKIFLSILSVIYAPFYYLFWFYFGYIGYVHLILKEYKKVLILIIIGILGLSFHLYYDFDSYIKMIQNVFNNDSLLIKYSVSESKPVFIPLSIKNSLGSSLLLLMLISISLIMYKIANPKNKLIKVMILLLPLFLIQHRFYELLRPIYHVFLLYIFFLSFEHIKKYGFDSFFKLLLDYIKEKSYIFEIYTKLRFYIIPFIIIIFFLLILFARIEKSNTLENNIKNLSFIQNEEFNNKLILFTTMNSTGYISLYLNPKAKFIPSCSLGWVTYNKEDKEAYLKLITNDKRLSFKDFVKIIKLNNPDYIIIDAVQSKNLNFSQDDLFKINYSFYKYSYSKLIFKKNSF